VVSIFLFDPAGVSFNVVRLCIVTPTAGGRVIEAGDEKVLLLADEAQSAFSTTVFIVPRSDPLVISSGCYRIHSVRPTGKDKESRVETGVRKSWRNSTERSEWGRGPESVYSLWGVSSAYDESSQDPGASCQSFRYIDIILLLWYWLFASSTKLSGGCFSPRGKNPGYCQTSTRGWCLDNVGDSTTGEPPS